MIGRLALAGIGVVVAGGCSPAPAVSPAPSRDEAFAAAVVAARSLTPADAQALRPVRAQRDGTVRVVVFTPYGGYADTLARSAPAEMVLPEVWVTLDGEVRDSCARFRERRDIPAQTARLLGLKAEDGPGRSFVELEVPAASLFRPSADPDPGRTRPCLTGMACTAARDADSARTAAFLERQRASTYPFTGLGYTYNWRRGARRYGASEYVVRAGTRARVLAVTPPGRYCSLRRTPRQGRAATLPR